MSPFELTRIPMLSRSTLVRAEEIRKDPAALKQGWAGARLLRVDPRGSVRFADGGGGLILDTATDVAAEPPAEAVFLGSDDDGHLWALRDPDIAADTRDLRFAAGRLSEFDAGVVTTALALLNWHDNARYSALDGALTRSHNGGWSRRSDSTGHEEFPRTDPAVICLIHDGADRVLLGRQHSWPAPMASLFAGFVEAGESLEACVVREIREEVGVDLTDVRYLGSQPWPFPRSLMLGFAAVADPAQSLVFSDGEIAEARWYTRAEIRSALADGDWRSPNPDAPLLLPGSISIARGIVEAWAG